MTLNLHTHTHTHTHKRKKRKKEKEPFRNLFTGQHLDTPMVDPTSFQQEKRIVVDLDAGGT